MLAERARRRVESGERVVRPEKAGADDADEDRDRRRDEKVFSVFRKHAATSCASEKGGGKRKARDADKRAGSDLAALGEEKARNGAGSESPRHDPG